MGAPRNGRKYQFGSSNSDAEIEYRRGRSLREERSWRQSWGCYERPKIARVCICSRSVIIFCQWFSIWWWSNLAFVWELFSINSEECLLHIYIYIFIYEFKNYASVETAKFGIVQLEKEHNVHPFLYVNLNICITLNLLVEFVSLWENFVIAFDILN